MRKLGQKSINVRTRHFFKNNICHEDEPDLTKNKNSTPHCVGVRDVSDCKVSNNDARDIAVLPRCPEVVAFMGSIAVYRLLGREIHASNEDKCTLSPSKS